MPIFRACFTPREKARTIFRALFFERITFASLAMALAFLSCFSEPARRFSLGKYRKRQKSHVSLSFVWIEYDLNLSDAIF